MTKEKTAEPTFFKKHYLGTTTIIGVFIALIDACILFKMNTGYLADGIGLAIVGIVTFFGMLIASSVFEEHRHEHEPKSEGDETNSSAGDKTLANVIAGKGIMRKAIASSLIITYIIVIGLYIDNGELNEAFPSDTTSAADASESIETNSTQSNVQLPNSLNGVSLQLIQAGEGGTSNNTESDASANPEKDESQTRPIPRSLLEHFTTVITAVVVFYFGADIATNWFKSKYAKNSNPTETPEQIEAKITKLKAKLVEAKKKTTT